MKALDYLKQQNILRGDGWIWIAYFCICVVSFLEVFSASSRLTYGHDGFLGPALSHFGFLVSGLLVVWVMHLIPYKLYYYFAVPLWGFSIILLGCTTLLGSAINDTTRWLSLGGITIQPSEIAKLGLICLAAKLFANNRNVENGEMGMQSFKRVLCCTIITCACIFSENLSTCLLTFIVIGLLAVVCQPPKIFYILALAAGILGGTGIVTMKNVSKETVKELSEISIGGHTPLHRLPTWHNRFVGGQEIPEDPHDYDIRRDMQATHARLAVATGGLLGKGFGNSVERDYLPHAYSDFIFSIVLEEGGIWLPTILLFLYLLIVYRSWVIAKNCKNRFPCYLVLGLSLMLIAQAMFNMAVAVDLFPITGQPLPLMSKGGTSTIITCSYLGMILSVSHTAAKKEPKAKKEPVTETIEA
ncbi:MAG: FtsW/RodA/SpoVE family cell cycle protein [Bacteroidaceae bacterium]|nr:FtsW/RodA/SpoVE family cell cycle protein [Bacteroidaceae bacterium]